MNKPPTETHVPCDSKAMATWLLEHQDDMEDIRRPWEPIWEECAKYMGPAWGGFANMREDNPKERDPEIVDSTAEDAADIYARGMLSGTTPARDTWAEHGIEDERLAELPEAKEFIERYTDACNRDLLDGGYYQARLAGFFQNGIFGMECILVDESVLGGIRFMAIPLRQVYVDVNFQGYVDTTNRKMQFNAREAAQKYGLENLPEAVQKAYRDKDRKTKFTFLHATLPNEDMNHKGIVRSFPVASWHVCVDEEQVVRRGGYHSGPYIVSRNQRLPGCPYSYSAGTKALANTKMLNEMQSLLLQSGQLAMAPPYLVPDDGFLGNFSYDSFALNYYRKDGNTSAADFRPLQVGGDPRFSLELLQRTEMRIQDAFMVKLFMAMHQRIEAGTTPTRAEVLQLTGEQMWLLGPSLLNSHLEHFDPLFDRYFQLKKKRMELPPVPPALDQADMTTNYRSPLFRAQKEHRANALAMAYQDALSISEAEQVDTEAMRTLNHEESMRYLLDHRGVPQRCIRTREEQEDLRRADRQAMQEAGGAQGMQSLLDQYQNLSKAPEDGSPAKRVLESVGVG